MADFTSLLWSRFFLILFLLLSASTAVQGAPIGLFLNLHANTQSHQTRSLLLRSEQISGQISQAFQLCRIVASNPNALWSHGSDLDKYPGLQLVSSSTSSDDRALSVYDLDWSELVACDATTVADKLDAPLVGLRVLNIDVFATGCDDGVARMFCTETGSESALIARLPAPLKRALIKPPEEIDVEPVDPPPESTAPETSPPESTTPEPTAPEDEPAPNNGQRSSGSSWPVWKIIVLVIGCLAAVGIIYFVIMCFLRRSGHRTGQAGEDYDAVPQAAWVQS